MKLMNDTFLTSGARGLVNPLRFFTRNVHAIEDVQSLRQLQGFYTP